MFMDFFHFKGYDRKRYELNLFYTSFYMGIEVKQYKKQMLKSSYSIEYTAKNVNKPFSEMV